MFSSDRVPDIKADVPSVPLGNYLFIYFFFCGVRGGGGVDLKIISTSRRKEEDNVLINLGHLQFFYAFLHYLYF